MVIAVEEEFRCKKCGEAEGAIGATIPGDTSNHAEYFLCHPELEVSMLNSQQVAAFRKRNQGVVRRFFT